MTRLLRISVDVDPDSEPITGSVEAGGARVDCYGWLELTAALDQAVQRARADRAAGSPSIIRHSRGDS